MGRALANFCANGRALDQNFALFQQLVFFNRLKQECRQGFATVHESITNSKQVLEGKLLLSEEQLRKEISHVRKMVVLV